MKTLDVGLLVDSVHSDKYVEELALWGKNQPRINISHLIVRPRPATRLAPLPARAIWRVLLSVERLLLRRSRPHKDHYAVRDLTKIVDQIVDLRTSGKDVEKVRALGLDLLINCGAAVPRDDPRGGSRRGGSSVVHGAVWGCYRRQPERRSAIRRLSEGR